MGVLSFALYHFSAVGRSHVSGVVFAISLRINISLQISWIYLLLYTQFFSVICEECLSFHKNQRFEKEQHSSSFSQLILQMPWLHPVLGRRSAPGYRKAVSSHGTAGRMGPFSMVLVYTVVSFSWNVAAALCYMG